jgi:hypothetical protein
MDESLALISSPVGASYVKYGPRASDHPQE